MLQRSGTNANVAPPAPNRRQKSRFPMEQHVSYKPEKKSTSAGAGTGRTINIGSEGVLFTTGQPLSVGSRVKVAINWPALLDGTCALRFIATGPVVRSDGYQAAVRIDRYEFRTRAIPRN
jgi:hypothetical protein